MKPQWQFCVKINEFNSPRESISMRSSLLIFILLCLGSLSLQAQEKFTINGYVKDRANGEDMFGATIQVQGQNLGTTSNMYGFYSLTLPVGNYTIEYRYLGYLTEQREVALTKNTRLDIELSTEQTELEEIIITAEDEDENVKSTEMSIVKIDIQTIKKLPPFLGETDVIRTIQQLPGVSSVGEGASGFNVRGGGVGQNLVLLDEAPVYNTSHLFGLFSVFNPDAVKDVKLYKGGIPARYGGRIASILDVRMKEGNNKNFTAEGGVGTVFSRFSVEGPIIKDKASFIVAGRRSYADVLAKPFTDVLDDGAALYFYDLTLKANYNIDQKNRVFASGYFGRDVFRFDANQGFNWGNQTATIRWNHLFNDRLFSNFTTYYSDYDYSLRFGDNDLDVFEWKSNIQTFNFKPEFTYFLNTSNELSFGGEVLYYYFDPASARGISNGETTDISVPNKQSMEYALYFSNDQKISSALSMNYGLRFSGFNYFGPGNMYEFADPEIAGTRKPLTGITEIGKGESIANYQNLEPRASLTYLLNEQQSIKASYNRTAQYLHLISNTVASNPLDVWTPSTNNIKPQQADQIALGYFRNFGPKKAYETSIETYYRVARNQVDYIDGADILINELLEGDLLSGEGRAYGLELYVRKNTGKLNGWVSYTLARTELKVDGINNGEWYPTRFDQQHNLKVTGLYELNERWSFSANFTYLSGTPTTFPTSRFLFQDYVIPHNYDASRNNIRIPDFHRLDISATLEGKKTKANGEPKLIQGQWIFGIYNVYSRRNPFTIYFSQDTDRLPVGQPANTSATQLAIIGSAFPSVTYNFKFLGK